MLNMRLLVILFLFSNYCGEGDPPIDSPVNTFDSVCNDVSKIEKHAFSQQVVLFPSFASFHKKNNHVIKTQKIYREVLRSL
jgi:hypothetical protein